MTQFAVIALNAYEHQQLLEVWSFFRFDPQIKYHYLYPGTSNDPGLPQADNFQARHFPESSHDRLPQMRKYLKQHGVEQLCFASLETAQSWLDSSGLPAITLYASKNLMLADLSSLPAESTDGVAELLDWTRLTPAVLDSEAILADYVGEISRYPDFVSFHGQPAGELLLTRNRDLVSAACHEHLASHSVCHYRPGWLAPNLALSEDRPDFLQTLNRLGHAATLACLEPEPPADVRSSLLLPHQVSYSLFADYYDAYMSHVDYEDWVNLMLGWYKRFGSQAPRKILEVACGTANASEILVFRGYDVDACDASPFMLHRAAGKAFKPRLFLASMTEPLPLKDYDFIFCLFDSINYLTHKAEISTLLQNVHAALRPGGIFIFDISTLLNSLQNFNDNTLFTRVKDGYLVQISNFEILSYRQITKLILFRKNLQGYDKLEERHVQRVYRSSELKELIAASGLALQAIFSSEMRTNLLSKPASDIDNKYCRLFFLLQKPE